MITFASFSAQQPSPENVQQTKTLKQSYKVVDNTHQLSAKSQKNIDNISDEILKLLQAYQQLNRNTQYQLAYQEQLQQTIAAQENEKQAILNKIDRVKTTQQQIMPLINEMANSLESFVQLDLPFNVKQRSKKIAELKKLLADPQIAVPEKFHELLESFKVENNYGYSTDVYQGELTDGSKRQVKYLRIGRMALYYQTLDGKEGGYWNAEQESWQILAPTYIPHINKAIKIAQNKVVPATMLLPIMLPEQGAMK